MPAGTTSNYFGARDSLVAGLVDRIGLRLAPEPAIRRQLADVEPSRELFAAYMRGIVARMMGEGQRAGFLADVEFNDAAALPAGRREAPAVGECTARAARRASRGP